MSGPTVRPYRPRDAAALARLFFRAVRIGGKPHYRRAQLRAWAPRAPAAHQLARRLAGQAVFVAARRGRPVGFMTLRPDGHLDMAFVDPACQRRGVAGLLHAAVLAEARHQGLARLTTDASFAARAFFRAKGWTVVRTQKVRRRGVALVNFRMQAAPGPS